MKKLKMAIVGAGHWGENHIIIYKDHPNVELVAICDLNISRASEVANRFGIENVYNSVNEMLKSCDFDAVAIVTPDFAHAETAIACANAKKHMLIEKPLATTRKDVLEMVDAFQKNNVRVMIDFHNRWNPPFQAAKQAIDNGELGDPYSAYYRLNDQKWVATEMLSWASKSSILWFLGSHSLDTLKWLFDDEVERVYAVSREGVLKSKGLDTIDMYLTTIEFKRGGIAHMENGWITPNASPNVNDIKFSLLGTKGMVAIDGSSHTLLQQYTDTKMHVPDILVQNYVFGKAIGFAYQSINHFIDKMISGENFALEYKDAAKTSLALLAVMESAKQGKPITVEY